MTRSVHWSELTAPRDEDADGTGLPRFAAQVVSWRALLRAGERGLASAAVGRSDDGGAWVLPSCAVSAVTNLYCKPISAMISSS